jgi:hypothetical protein
MLIRYPTMHPLEATLSVVGPIVGAIIVLTLFFKLMARWSGDSKAKTRRFGFEGILDSHTKVTVHLVNGGAHENVRFVGFTDSQSTKGVFPHELRAMVILEEESGRRVLIPAKSIRMIEVPPPTVVG